LTVIDQRPFISPFKGAPLKTHDFRADDARNRARV